MTKRGEPLPINQALNRPRAKLGLDLGTWMTSRFHNYSFGNILEIARQKPDASRVAGFWKWKELGRSVKKGEKGIRILAPIIGVRRKKQEEAEKDITKQNEAIVVGLSFSSNENSLSNQGIGGLSLAESGYSSTVGQYDFRLTNTQTLNASALHVTRVGFTWKRSRQSPLSTLPSLQVAGYFSGGGSTAGSLDNRERDLEMDDDLTWVQGKHVWKIGVQSLGLFMHDYNPDTFNGAYVFWGWKCSGVGCQ